MEGIAQGDRSSLLLSFVFALVLWSMNLLPMPNISLGIKHLRSQGMWEWHRASTEALTHKLFPELGWGRLELGLTSGILPLSPAGVVSTGTHFLIYLGIKDPVGFWEVMATNSVGVFFGCWKRLSSAFPLFSPVREP